jgi:MFS family permease
LRDRPRAGVSVAFLVFGVTVGGLIPRVPALKDHLHLTDGQVGLALLGVSLGGIAGSLASRLVVRRRVPSFVRGGILALCVVATGPGLAPNLAILVVSLFLVGFLWGFSDVLENALGAQLERTRDRHLINGFHGFWSLGAFAGSLVAGAAAGLDVIPVAQFITTGAVLGVGSVWFLRDLPELDEPASRRAHLRAISLTTAVLTLAALSFAAVIAEGGTSDWSPLFLRELSHASPAIAAAGFSGFSLAAMLVRFRADRLTARTSRQAVARLGALIAVAGLGIVIVFPALPTAIAGFTLVGMGTAVVLPLAFAAGANLGSTGTALALVMASTYAGTIAGPPLIGLTADHLGLRAAMGIPLAAAFAVVLLAGSLRPERNQLGPPAELAVGRVSGRS